MTDLKAETESDIKKLLIHPEGLPWTIQGFGMLRLYTDDKQIGRLHIWDTEQMAVADVTRTHDHPWDFTSRIVSGQLTNLRFEYATAHNPNAVAWDGLLIKTGEDAKGLAPIETHWLTARGAEAYVPGDTYHQDAPEIHESVPSRGAVTVVRRTFSRERDRAMVFCREGAPWVDAKVRPATPDEIRHFCQLALDRWDT